MAMSPLHAGLIIGFGTVAVILIILTVVIILCRRRRRMRAAAEPSGMFIRLVAPRPDASQCVVNGNATLERDFGNSGHFRMEDLSLEVYSK